LSSAGGEHVPRGWSTDHGAIESTTPYGSFSTSTVASDSLSGTRPSIEPTLLATPRSTSDAFATLNSHQPASAAVSSRIASASSAADASSSSAARSIRSRRLLSFVVLHAGSAALAAPTAASTSARLAEAAFHTVSPVAGQITGNVAPPVAPDVVSPLTRKGTVNDVSGGILRCECFCSSFPALVM